MSLVPALDHPRSVSAAQEEEAQFGERYGSCCALKAKRNSIISEYLMNI